MPTVDTFGCCLQSLPKVWADIAHFSPVGEGEGSDVPTKRGPTSSTGTCYFVLTHCIVSKQTVTTSQPTALCNGDSWRSSGVRTGAIRPASEAVPTFARVATFCFFCFCELAARDLTVAGEIGGTAGDLQGSNKSEKGTKREKKIRTPRTLSDEWKECGVSQAASEQLTGPRAD